tara:strand:+ start:7020 stop:8765 length:1746 start_codon:yes stop_codon:yes gene_type:complete
MDSNTVTAVTPLLAPIRSEVSSAKETAQSVVDNQSKVTRRLGSILLDMERMDASMKVTRRELQKDIRLRRRELNREAKIVKKDQKNLELLKTSFFGIRDFIGKVSFVSALANLAKGDFGNAAVDAGTAALSYLPEIAGGVATILGLKAVSGGNRGRGRVPQGGVKGVPRGGRMGGGRAGGIMALLALGAMALGSMSGGQESGDQRRGQLLKEGVAAENIINQGDVQRFGSISRRFSIALDKLAGLTLGEDKKDDPNASDNKEGEGGDGNGDGDNDGSGDPQGPKGPRVTSDADQSKAFRSGLVTGPEEAIGMTPTADGRNAYHVDTKFSKDLPMEDVVNMMDQLAAGYEAQGRTMEMSNKAVAGRRYSTDLTYDEKVKLINDSFAAHSHSPNRDFNSLDYYINKENEDRFGESAENVEILVPTRGGSFLVYKESPGYGAFVETTDDQGKVLTKTGHGDDRKFKMPTGGLVINIDPATGQPRSQQVDENLPDNYSPANIEPPALETDQTSTEEDLQSSLPVLPSTDVASAIPPPTPVRGAGAPPSNESVTVEAVSFSGTGNAIANLNLLSNYNSPSLLVTVT